MERTHGERNVGSMIDFETHPDRYRHWRLSVDGRVATLALDVDEEGGIAPGYALKLNSYDLGVDIELNDAIQRLRFEHPEVGAVVVTSARDRVFCAGANIPMLAGSTQDRTSVVWGQRVSDRVYLGGRRDLKIKKTYTK